MAEHLGNLCLYHKSWPDHASYLWRRHIKVKTPCPCNHFVFLHRALDSWDMRTNCWQRTTQTFLHMNWCLVSAVGTQPKLQTMPAYDIYSQSGVSLDDAQHEGKGCWRHAQSVHRLSSLLWLQDLENILVYGQVAHTRGLVVRGSIPAGARYGINFENWYFSAFGPCAFLSSFFKDPVNSEPYEEVILQGPLALEIGRVVQSGNLISVSVAVRCGAMERWIDR